jgi:hypothetical protein
MNHALTSVETDTVTRVSTDNQVGGRFDSCESQAATAQLMTHELTDRAPTAIAGDYAERWKERKRR